jgi:[ribosomal protein S18]-alanine N-acetyltransferase
MRIRPCREEDLAQLEELIKGAPEAAAWSGNSLRQSFIEYGPYFLAAFQGTEIEGFICGRRVADEAEILNLAVRPDRRRQGIAHKLVATLLEIVATEGVTRVHLEVRESNVAAIRLYTQAGFRVAGKRPGYYQAPAEAAVLMAVSAITP